MRTLLAGELAQAKSYLSSYFIKLEVQNGSGTWIDVGAALGRKWIVNASWGETVESKVMQATFTLWQEMGGNSLSPLMTASVLNRDDALAYSPLLMVGRLVRASTATMPHLTALDVAKYREFVTGRIDNVQQADSLVDLGPITIVCSDLGGWLMDMQIESSGRQFGTTPTGTALETVIQNVLNANIPTGEPAVTLYKQSASVFLVTDWKQGDTKVLDALNTLVLDSTGEDIRYRYDAAHASRLTWFNPDRTRVTVDATFAPGYTMRQLDLALADIRNAGEMPYVGGKVSAVDAASILKFRRRFFRLPASPMITSSVDAQKVIDSVTNDLSAPPGEAAVVIPFFWPVQLWDRYTFTANGRQFDSDQTFAVMGYEHRIEKGQGSTTLTLTARLVGAFSEWLKRIGDVAKRDNEIHDLRRTDSADGTESTFAFTLGLDVDSVWVGSLDITAPEQSGDWDLVAASVAPLAPGVLTYTVTRPVDGHAVLIQLEPRDASLNAGTVRRVEVTATPQVPHVELDDLETGTIGTQWWKLTERGIAVTAVEVQTQVGISPVSGWGAPTRGPGDVSTVRGGTLGAGEYEHDVQLDPTRQSWVMPRLTLENGAPPIVLGPFGFDRDKNPNLGPLTLDSTNRYVTIVGDADTKSVGLYSTTRGWKYEVDGSFATIDVQAAGTSGSGAGLGAATADTFTAKAWAEPVADITGGTLYDARDIYVLNGAGAGAAVLSIVTAFAPGGGSDVASIKLKASAAPGGWTIRVFIAESIVTTNPVPTVNETANLTPVPSAPPTVETTYLWTSDYSRSASGSRLVTMKIKAELVNGGVVQDTKSATASWYTGPL